jgi:hypothetical protein
MNYIGNFANWITPELMKHLETHDGDLRNVWQPEKWNGHPLLDEYRIKAEPAYSHGKSTFHQFANTTEDMKNFKVELPDLPDKRKVTFWWFIKLLPGEMQAMHIDPHLVEVENPIRYTMFLQDWEPGHIFTYDDKMLSNYKAGDVYEWSDPMIVHGVSNISYNTRYTLQITLHD